MDSSTPDHNWRNQAYHKRALFLRPFSVSMSDMAILRQSLGDPIVWSARSTFWRLAMKPIRILTLMVGAYLVSVAFAQQPANTSNWSEFHRQNMMRWNQYETVLGVNNVA